MEKITARQVQQLAQELGFTYNLHQCRQLAELTNQECRQSRQNLEPETAISMALLAIAQEKQTFKHKHS